MTNRDIMAVALGTLCLTGCFAVDVGDKISDGHENVVVSNYGWYLFDLIPLACGNASEDPAFPIMMFRNDVTMAKIQRRFMSYAKERGMKASNLQYSTRDSVMLEIPGLNLPLPVPYLLTYREIQLSGVLK